jgi:hypothetical protein
MQNKRGQGLSTSTIVLIILGVVILAVLLVGFTVGWSKILPWISSDNVDSIVTQCSVACSTKSSFDYCTKTRELKSSELPKGVKIATGTCYGFSDESNQANYSKFGIEKCSSINCASVSGANKTITTK